MGKITRDVKYGLRVSRLSRGVLIAGCRAREVCVEQQRPMRNDDGRRVGDQPHGWAVVWVALCAEVRLDREEGVTLGGRVVVGKGPREECEMGLEAGVVIQNCSV